MASISKYQKDGKTFYKFQVYLGINEQTGKKRYTTRRGFDTLREARLVLSKLELQADSGQLDQQPINLTFEDVYQQWWAGYINTVRESTMYKQKKVFQNHILPAFGKYRIRTITTSQVQTTLNKWFKQTDYSFKPWFNYTSAIFKYAILQGYVKDNPCTRVTMPKKLDKEDTLNFWDKDQLKTFFNGIDPVNDLEKYTLFRVLAFTGIRRGECLSLTWDDLNVQKATLDINKTLTHGDKGRLLIQPTKTKKGTRVISLDESTLLYLKKWHLEQRRMYLMLGYNINKSNQLIFATSKNTFKSLNTPSKWLRALIDDANKSVANLPSITVHGFRHSHASALFSAGASIKEVQERLGHEDAQTTLNIYTHVTEKQGQEAVQKLVNFLNF
ncbi:Site-specific recombinase, prophage lsa1 integrase [Latilactobacillus sakei]|uniref:site-specific integrase n=1 Tax=Latilactobacillus sakei TaxID=1599 RepID=UPI000C6F1788|nr:site-specific integrase [Latilactobacillus sakei]MCB4409871.1 site-specific integrase [Latilactobacillus sakei]SON66751.1 Site-specific recombinase, prophage lsa1 integrase [Latilactobacillus sakei]